MNVVPLRSSFEPTFRLLAARVGAREQSLVGAGALARGDEPAARDERRGDDADVRRRRIDAGDRVGGALDVRLRRIDDLLQRLLRRRDRGAEALQPRRQALGERAPVAAAGAAPPPPPRPPPPAGAWPPWPPWPSCGAPTVMPAFCRHVCIAVNSAAVGRGICRLTRICWPPALIFATIFGTVPDWCTAASTRPLETDATPSTFAIWAAVVWGTSAACRAGRSRGRTCRRACRASRGR